MAFLEIDLTDPEFHRIALDTVLANEAAIAGLVAEAILAGELPSADPRSAARLLLGIVSGGLLNWGIVREGSARDWILRDVDLAIDHWRHRADRPGAG